MFMHGNKDPLVHIDGGPVLRDRGAAICLAQAAAFWRKLDGTSAQLAVENLPSRRMTEPACGAKSTPAASKARRLWCTSSKAEAIPDLAALNTCPHS